MYASVGIGLAFVAMLCWGIGDFLIQRSTRKIGDFETLLAITGPGALILLPFVWRNLGEFFFDGATFGVLAGGSFILFVAALLEFEALKRGKISVIEPTWSLEIPTSVLLAYIILSEKLSFYQLLLILSLIIGLFLISYRGQIFSFRFFVERGVLISLLAAVFMGTANFFVGWGARLTDPLLMNFFLNVFIAVASGLFLLARGELHKFFRDFVQTRKLMLPMLISDNAAWVAFAFAMTLAPIGIAVALSESYIIVAVILGLAINRERLERHQKFGLIAAIAAAITLAATMV